MKRKTIFPGRSTRREFLIGATGLALATVLPSCSYPKKTTATKRTKEPQIATVTNQELGGSCAWIGKDEQKTAYALFKKTVEATTDFEWLSNAHPDDLSARVLILISIDPFGNIGKQIGVLQLQIVFIHSDHGIPHK